MSEELRERVARALWKHRYPGVEQAGPLADLALTDADAVIADLGLGEAWSRMRFICDPNDESQWCEEFDRLGYCQHLVTQRRYVTTWERIEEDR